VISIKSMKISTILQLQVFTSVILLCGLNSKAFAITLTCDGVTNISDCVDALNDVLSDQNCNATPVACETAPRSQPGAPTYDCTAKSDVCFDVTLGPDGKTVTCPDGMKLIENQAGFLGDFYRDVVSFDSASVIAANSARDQALCKNTSKAAAVAANTFQSQVASGPPCTGGIECSQDSGVTNGVQSSDGGPAQTQSPSSSAR